MPVLKVFMESEKGIDVHVSYLTAQTQFLRTLRVAQGSTVEDVIRLSGVLQEFPELTPASLKTGIYSKLRPLDWVVQHQDRVEIYRPLLVDPMVARRTRANKKR